MDRRDLLRKATFTPDTSDTYELNQLIGIDSKSNLEHFENSVYIVPEEFDDIYQTEFLLPCQVLTELNRAI